MSDTLTEPSSNRDTQVPMSVLDRVIKLAQENNLAYNQIVSALDSLSSRSVEVSDAVDKLSCTIENEQLADVIRDNLSNLQKEITKMKESLAIPKYNLLVAIASVMEFNRTTDMAIQQHASAVIWAMEVIDQHRTGILLSFRLFSHIYRNSVKYSFFGGVLLAGILLGNGVSIYEFFKSILFH